MTNKKIKLLWAILCEKSSIDNRTNNVSLFNVVEQLQVSKQDLNKTKNILGVPMRTDFELVSLWQKEEKGPQEKIEARIELIDPLEKLNQEAKYEFIFQASKLRTRVLIKVPVIKITSAGNYKFRFFTKEKGSGEFILMGELPLQVEIK